MKRESLWKRIAREEVERIVRSLPPDLRCFADEVGVSYESGVAAHWVEDGVAPDSLGLFSGPSRTDADYGIDFEPPLITLFVANLRDFADGDAVAFRHEVRTTYLHEFGHYLGLEEPELNARGLE